MIRELKARDVKTLAHILGKLKSTSIGDLTHALNGKGDPMSVGLSIFHIVAADLTDDIYAWLADLIGKSVEELDEMPISTPIDIIKELVNRGEFKDFFGLATRRGRKPRESTTSSSTGMVGETKK